MWFDARTWMIILTVGMFIVIPMVVIIFSLMVAAGRSSRMLEKYMAEETLKEIHK